MKKFLIIDDHVVVRSGIKGLLAELYQPSITEEAHDGESALACLKHNFYDLVLLDIQMPKMDGFETCKILKANYPNLHIIIISQLTTKESIHKVMEIGAHGFFTKNSNPDQLEEAIRSVRDKGYYFGNELGSVLREALLWEKKANESTMSYMEDSAQLTSREIDIIKLAAKELSSKEMADELNIAHNC